MTPLAVAHGHRRRLDPRTKLGLCFLYATLIVALPELFQACGLLAILLLAVVFMGRAGDYRRWLRLVLPMAVFFGAVTAWSAGAVAGAAAGVKLLALTSTFFVLFATTAPEDLGNALVRAGLPYALAFIMSAALNFVPVIGRKARNVLDAQRARGIPLEPGWSALRHYPAFLGPLLIQALQMAEELAEAMEARGYGRPGRTFLNTYRMGLLDWGLLLASLGIVAAVIVGFHG
jgi:energy-coupling factor transport system permease protein